MITATDTVRPAVLDATNSGTNLPIQLVCPCGCGVRLVVDNMPNALPPVVPPSMREPLAQRNDVPMMARRARGTNLQPPKPSRHLARRSRPRAREAKRLRDRLPK